MSRSTRAKQSAAVEAIQEVDTEQGKEKEKALVVEEVDEILDADDEKKKNVKDAGTIFGFSLPSHVRMVIACSGLVACFLIYGILQERLMTVPYGLNGEMFIFSAFLVLNNRIVVVLVAAGLLMAEGQSVVTSVPLFKFMLVGFTNTIATLCQYEALKHISFPTQTIGKCGKMIPVMVISVFLGTKHYKVQDFVSALAISLGCAMFIMSGDTSPQQGREGESVFGVLLMIVYLSLDGFTSTMQEKLFHDYNISSNEQMLYVNLASGIYTLIYLLGTGQMSEALLFTIAHPSSYAAALLLSIAACCGQITIYYIIKNFGALVFATTMVFRHVVSIVLSCIVFFHPLTVYQWFAGSIVIGTYYVNTIWKRKRNSTAFSEEKDEATNDSPLPDLSRTWDGV
eukprot:CAMPEP_0119122802 /NCGR_PEP_ID=MMETSP1310-20130426/2952_1 /TAXON_ID=464262 /ORGANISM="Genus nov. species nov., Strain RCC2339" /LENGTH=397 /DNA_ID=CAMNT_0007112515 /DNA_START=333 /DNA_END=1523 /DNA_ORIENTATION=+